MTPIGRGNFQPTFASTVQDDNLSEWLHARDDKLSNYLGEEATHLDFFLLCIELLKLSIHDREQFIHCRREERAAQMKHMLEVVKNYQSQGDWLKSSGIASGICNLLGAICPILNHTHGEGIVGFFGKCFSRFQGMSSDDFFRSTTKLLGATSKSMEMTSQVHNMYSESSRVKDYHYSELAKSDYDQRSEDIRNLLQHFRETQESLHNINRIDYDSARSLFN